MQAGEEKKEALLVGKLMDEPFAESAPLVASIVAVCQVQVLLYAL